MGENRALPLKVVDGLMLPEPLRKVLRPGELVRDERGHARRLPRFFYEVESWGTARKIELAPNFELWEFMQTDVREAEELRKFPRYIPCAVTLLAAHLSVFREKVGTFVYLAANGGYRSPGHGLSTGASPHQWGAAANIYKIGHDYLDDQNTIEHYSNIAREVLPDLWIRPYGSARGFADDHLHLDLGYVTVVPREAAGEEEDHPDPMA